MKLLEKWINRLIEWGLLALIGLHLAGSPPIGEAAQTASTLFSPGSRWAGPGTLKVDEITNCYGPSVPMRADLAPNPPYAQASVVQYIHGCDYSHAAIDYIAVGDDTVLSPITGCVVANTYDGIGNPVLKIENEQYMVTMLHGDYYVRPGDCVKRGQPVGGDNSTGGYIGSRPINHTHLSIYDKLVGHNAHPLALIK